MHLRTPATFGDMNWTKCKVSKWKGAPQMETGAPMPYIVSDGNELFVAYFVAGDGSHATADCYAVVRFSGVLQHTFGYPNEDIMAHHPLYSRGLEAYAFNEIENSPYVSELADRTSAVFPNSKPRYLKYKHWIITFHDETLEVVGDAVAFLGSARAGSAVQAIEKLSQRSDAR